MMLLHADRFSSPAGTVWVVVRPVVDLWARASRDSERVSQLLGGARVVVLTHQDDWVRVEGPDTYRGWMESRFLEESDGRGRLEVANAFVDLRSEVQHRGHLVSRLPMGVGVEPIRRVESWTEVSLGRGISGWLSNSQIAPASTEEDPCGPAASLAISQLGTPYLWGGSTPFGFDCSGLIQWSYARVGLVLRRDADQQRLDPRFVAVDRFDSMPGDLVFFGTGDRIDHVGMQLGDGRFVHAAGGDGTMVSTWGEDRFTPRFVDARRLNPRSRWVPVLRHEEEDR